MNRALASIRMLLRSACAALATLVLATRLREKPEPRRAPVACPHRLGSRYLERPVAPGCARAGTAQFEAARNCSSGRSWCRQKRRLHQCLWHLGREEEGLVKVFRLQLQPNLSSLRHTGNRPSVFLASLATVSKGGGVPGAGGAAGGVAPGLDPAAAAVGPPAPAIAGLAPGAVPDAVPDARLAGGLAAVAFTALRLCSTPALHPSGQQVEPKQRSRSVPEPQRRPTRSKRAIFQVHAWWQTRFVKGVEAPIVVQSQEALSPKKPLRRRSNSPGRPSAFRVVIV